MCRAARHIKRVEDDPPLRGQRLTLRLGAGRHEMIKQPVSIYINWAAYDE